MREVDNIDVKDLESEYDSLQKQKQVVDTQIPQLLEELEKLSRQANLKETLEMLRKKREEVEIKVNDM